MTSADLSDGCEAAEPRNTLSGAKFQYPHQRSGGCKNTPPDYFLVPSISVPTLIYLAKHLSTELAFYKAFLKIFSLASHHITRPKAYAS